MQIVVWALVLALLVSASGPVRSAAPQGEATLRWFGHAFVLITSPEGVRVAMDPFGEIGYPMPDVEADVVTISHGHGDHSNAPLVKGKPEVLQGLTPDGRDWARVNFRRRDVTITSFRAYHDKAQGKQRGLNTLFLVEVGGLRIAHLSDIGHVPAEEALRALGRVDILLVPVGGVYSIDGAEATQLADRLKAAITIPIHYKTEATASWPIADELAFLEGKPRVRRVGNSVRISRELLPRNPEVWVMDYR